MKKLFGHSRNIETAFIGKITRKPVFFRKNYVFITDNKIENGYAALLSQNDIKHAAFPMVCNVDNLDELNSGDIVLIEPNGMINILYEVKSDHNILMITERCNCSCIMCPQPRVAVEQDKTRLNLKLISLMSKNTKCLGLSGGEPTLLGDKLIDILMACKKHLPKTALTLLTNGIKLDDFEYVKKIVSINHPDLIIDIPLYSATDTEHDEIIGAKGFYKIIKGLYNLALLKQKVGIRIVVHKLNYNRLPELSEFIYRNFPFVFHVAFMQMETTGLAERNIEQVWIDPHDYNNELEKAVTILSVRDINVSIYNAQLCVLPKNLWDYSRRSISLWKNIYLDECSSCSQKNKCGGLFASSKDMHSSYIKPISNLKINELNQPIDAEQDFRTGASKTFLKFSDYILKVKDYPILDVPSGYGRNSFLLASLGCKVICADINQKALDYILECQKKNNFEKDISTQKIDLEKDRWNFGRETIGGIINVHYYNYKLLDDFITSLILGGFLYLETPDGHGGNYIALPTKGIIISKLKILFKILYYKENNVGPPGSNRVTVKVFAQKIGQSTKNKNA